MNDQYFKEIAQAIVSRHTTETLYPIAEPGKLVRSIAAAMLAERERITQSVCAIDQIRQRLAAITPGPWEVEVEPYEDGGVPLLLKVVMAPTGEVARTLCNYPEDTERGMQDLADMSFIAHAPQDIASLLDALLSSP